MTTLRDLLSASVRTPTISLKLAGRSVSDVLRARAAQAYGSDGVGSGTVVLRNPPTTPQQGQSISWSWGFNYQHIPGFTGYVVDVEKLSYPDTWQLGVRDVLWLASREQRAIATSPLNSITANAAIAQILAGAGVTRLSLPTIPRPSGGTWTLGQLTPVSWQRTTALAACQEICKAAGYWLYADAGGTVRAAAIERRPSSSAAWSFLDGRDFLVDSPPQRRRDGNQVRNRVTVRGAATGVQGAQLYDTFSATHALYSGVIAAEEYSSSLLEYIDDVTAVAERLTGLLNRKPDTITFAALFNPYVSLAQTVAVRDPYIGLPGAKTYFVYSVDHDVDYESGRARTSITADGGLGSAGYSLVPEPTAVITYTLETETVGGDAVVVIHVDGSGSISNTEGEIVAWQWSMADTPYGSTPSGSSSPHAAPVFTFVTLASNAPFSISLTVTDTSSKTGAATVEIPLTGDVVAPVVEAVHTAAGSAWSYTADGGATWADEVRTTTQVAEGAGVRADAPAADGGAYGALAISGAEVRQTLDGLGSTSALLSTAGGSVTALHVNARNGARVWRAVGATLQRSTDGGTTWTTTGTAPGSVRQIIEDPALNDSIFVLSGANVYNSTFAGASWGTLYAGPAGATARWMERSDDGTVTWVCYTGTFTDSPLHRIEGPLTALFPTVSPAVSEVRAIALTRETPPRIVAVDQEGRSWFADGLTGLGVTQGPTLPAGGVAQHATASRAIPGLVYVADFDSEATGTGALRKILLDSGAAGAMLPWRPGPSGRQYHMVALASARVAAVSLLLAPFGATGGDDNVWIYSRGAWRSVAPPAASRYWYIIRINPFNPADWILIGNTTSSNVTAAVTSGGAVNQSSGGQSILWRTTDSGVTWSQVALTSPVTDSAGLIVAQALYDTFGNWVVVAFKGTNNGARQTIIWRGAAAAVTTIPSSSGDNYAVNDAALGQNGDIILAPAASAEGPYASYRIVITQGDAASVPAGTAPGAAGLPRIIPGTRSLVAVVGGTLWRSTDYRAAQPAATGLSGLSDVAPLADGTLLVPATGGVGRVLDPMGTPSLETFYSGETTTGIVVDAATATVAVARGASGNLLLYDGESWVVVPLPLSAALVGSLACSAESL